MFVQKIISYLFFLLSILKITSISYSANINNVAENFNPVKLYEKCELTIDLTADYSNPFDPDDIDLWAKFTAPSFTEWNRINGFWDGSNWKIRFAANEIGIWEYTVYLDDGSGQVSSGPATFSVIKSEHHGWIKVSDTNPRYLEFSDDSSFYGVGQSRAWNLPSVVPNIYTDMKLHKMNILHYWMPSWDNILVTDASGYDHYDMVHANNIDEVITNCENNGIALVFTIWNHDELRGAGHSWPRHYFDEYNPFRQLSSANGFFTDETSWDYQQKLYRYIIARWGYSRAIGLWQTICEIDGTSNSYNNDAITDPWHVKINTYFKQNDPFAHPTTASKSNSPWNWTAGFSEMDVIQIHTYVNNPVDIATTVALRTQSAWDNFSKPVFHGEFGDNGNSNNQQPEHLHNGLWAGLCSGGAITPLDWNDGGNWADFTSEMYDHARYLSKFMEDLHIDNEILTPAALSINSEFNTYGLVSDEKGILWVQDLSPGEMNSGVVLNITVLNEGKYSFDWHNTWNGEFYANKIIERTTTSAITTTIPDFEKDIACRITRVGALSDKAMHLYAVGDVTTWPDTDFRWKDIEDNLYSSDYQNSFVYDSPRVIISYDSSSTIFSGKLIGYNLKPNFAYQIKLVGKPEKDWGDDGNDASNELIGFEGRWWRKQPNPGNSNDQDYLAHKDDPDYIYEGYLLFDYFVTDEYGYGKKNFEAVNSFHVLWNTVINSRAPGVNDSPISYHLVRASIQNDIYPAPLEPDEVGLYAEWEPGRDLPGQAQLPSGEYNVRFILTEESFHQSGLGGYWASAMGYDNVKFTIASYSDAEFISGTGTYHFNEPAAGGDGHEVNIVFNSLSGSGNVYVQQINVPPSDAPCDDVLNLYWNISIDETITAYSVDLTFHYTDSDVAGYDESSAFLGIAKFNSSTNTWQWLGGTVDADNNTVTVNGVTSFSTFALFRRIFGDITGDGYVDAADLQRLGDCWHETDSGEFTGGSDARFFNFNKNTDSGNQVIDAADLQVFGDCWHNGVAGLIMMRSFQRDNELHFQMKK